MKKNRLITFAFVDASNMIYRDTEMKYKDEYDQAVFITGDGDFYWLFEYLASVKEKIWLMSSPGNKKEADPFNVSTSGITQKRYHKVKSLSRRKR